MRGSCRWGEATGNLRGAIGLVRQEAGAHLGRRHLGFDEGGRQVGATGQGTGLSDFEGVGDGECDRG